MGNLTEDDSQEANINIRLLSPKNLRELWPRRCCATCRHLLFGDDGTGILVDFCERPDGPSYWSEGENHDEQFYNVCDYWKAGK